MLERRFLGASERRASRARRRARLAVGALGVAALGFAALAAAALVERSRADDERTRAAARELAASALAQLERDPELAVRLAAEAARRSDEPDVVSVLRRTLSTSASRGTTQVSTASVNDVAFSPNGQVVAAAAGDGVRLWRVGAAAPQRRIGGKRPVPLTVAFGEDGKRLLVLYADGIRVWDLEHGGPPRLLTLSAQAAAFAPDGRLVATSAGGKTVDLWDIAARRRVARIPIPRTAGSDVSLDVLAFSADGKRLAVAWEEDRVRVAVIDVRARRVDAGPFRLAESASSLALNADGSRLAVGGEKARVLNTTVGTVEATTDAVPEGVADVDFSADGNLLVAAANDGTGRVFASGTGELLRELRGHRSVVRKGAGAIEENGATATAVDPTGRLVATAGLDGTVRFWSAGSAGDSEQVTGSGGQIPFAVDQRHAQVAAFGSGGRLSVWRVTGHRLVERRQVRLPSVRAIALSPDGLTVATASDTGTLRAYPIEGGRSAAEHVFRDHWFSRLAFSPDGNTFAGAGDHLDLVAARTLAPIRPSRRATPSNFWEVVWSPDGALVATGGSDRRIRIWDARRSIRPRVLRGHRGDVTALAFSPDGAVLASGSADATVRIWDAGTFAPRAIVSGHSVNVLDVNFSPDAEFFVTAGGDGKVRIWETRTLESVMVVGGAEAARAASFVSSDVIASAVWESGGAQALLRLTACDVCVPRRRLLELVDERRTRALAVEERRRYLHE
jgi:WD40 repeat protein